MASDNVIPLVPLRPCPVCGHPATRQFRPFCSARCADVDLHRWLSGSYVIPARDNETEADEADPALPPVTDDDDI